jgi:hypothetical protein
MKKNLMVKTNENAGNTYEFKFNGWMNFIINAGSEKEAFNKFFKTFPSAEKVTCECENNKEKFDIIDDVNYSVC